MTIIPFDVNRRQITRCNGHPALKASGRMNSLGFCKLVVHDLETQARFYREVCELTEWQHTQGKLMVGNGEMIPIREIRFLPDSNGGAALSLLKFLKAPEASFGEMIIGFFTDDIDAFTERALSHGGRIAQPAKRIASLRQTVAYLMDPEGHLLEVIEQGV